MTFLTPLGGLVAILALLPVSAAIFAHRRTDSVRRALGLNAPERRTAHCAPALAAAGIALLGLAVAQPAFTRTSTLQVRRDVQALFVLDTSRSMAASPSPSAPNRLDRAEAAAIRLRSAIPQVESGVLTLTDRVLPDLLPVADLQGFDGVVQRAVRIESPPPRNSSVRATSYDALAGIVSGNDFAPTASRRIVVLLSDGESDPVQNGELAGPLAPARGYRFLAVRFWGSTESVYDPDGKPEAGYRADPSGLTTLHDLATALGGRSFEEGQIGSAAAYLSGLAGAGPTVRNPGSDRSRVPLAPYVALVGVLLLLAAVAPPGFAPPRIRLSRQ
jgi:hypothetical protein